MILVRSCDNVFARERSWSVSRQPHGRSASSYAPSWFDGVNGIAFRNGCRLHEDAITGAGDVLSFVALPTGAAGAIGAGTTGVLGGAAISAGTLTLVSLSLVLTLVSFGLRSSSHAPGVRERPKNPDEGDSPTRGFNGIQNTRGAGFALGFIYGTHRVGGHIFDEFERELIGAGVSSVDQTDVVRSETPAGSPTSIFRRIAIAEGPVKSITDIQFDDIAIGSIRGVTYQTSVGLDSDRSGRRAPAGFDRTGVVTPIDTPVTKAGGAETFESSGDIDSAELVLRFANGLYVNWLGIIIGWTIEVKIEYRVNDVGAAWTTLTGANIKIEDKSVAPVEHRVSFPLLDRAQYQFRVTRITDDTVVTGPAIRGQDTAFSAKDLIEYTTEEFSHPQIAKLELEHAIIDQESQLRPTRITSLVEGYNQIRIYTDESTYTLGFTQNPAWILADFITNTRWGSGRIFTYDDIDIASFLDWAEYCDEVVDDGDGGTHARCTYDYVHDVQEDVQTIRNRMAFAGDAWLIRMGGSWKAVIDRAASPVDLFNDSNIEPGSLQYAYVPRSERATHLTATLSNAELNYARDSLTFEDDDTIESGDPHIPDEVDCFGMTRTAQVIRTLRRLILWNKYSDRKLSFRTGLEGFTIQAGDVFRFASRYAGVGLEGGRVVETRNGGKTIVLDGFVELEDGVTYELIIRHTASNNRQTKTVTTAASRTDTVHVANDWTEPLEIGDTYSLGVIGGSTELFRVTSISVDEDYVVTVEARKYSDLIYPATALVVPPSTALPSASSASAHPQPVSDLTLLEVEPENSASETYKAIAVSWNQPVGGVAARWHVYYRRDIANEEQSWNLAATVTVRNAVIDRVSPSLAYRVAVVSVGAAGNSRAIEDSTQQTITTTA